MARTDEARLARLIDVGRGLLSELDLEGVLRRLLAVAQEVTGARYAAVGILNEDRDGLERFVTTGIDDQTHREIGDLPRGRGVLGVLIDDPKPLRLHDVGTHPRSYGFPPAHPPMHTFLGVPIEIRGEAWGNLYLTEKDGGGDFSEEDEESVVIIADWAAIAIENARLYQRVERRRDELERAVAGLEATTEIAHAVGGELELERVLELIAKRGRALVDARTLVILLEEAGELRLAAVAGDASAVPHDASVAVSSSLYGEVARNRRPERVPDLSARLGAWPERLGIDASSALLVPLLFRREAVGVLAAFDRAGESPVFTRDDERLLLLFAASAAIAVRTAKSVAEDRLRHSVEAAEAERRHWARELHDETLQGLAGIRLLLSSVLDRGSDDGVERSLGQALEQTEAQIEALRTLITELRPAALDEIGLAPAVESLVDRARVMGGLSVDLDVDLAYEAGRDANRLSPALERTIYRLIQEALSNVIKHARADNVSIALHEGASELTVEISDDGLGFDSRARTSGFGLTGMRERVMLARGRIEIASTPGQGTSIAVSVPVERSGATQRVAS